MLEIAMASEIKTTYNKQAIYWHTSKPRTVADVIARPLLLKLCRKVGKNKVVLDIGCGEGYLTRKIASFTKKVIGVDLSQEMIKLAEELPETHIKYYVSDMKNLSFLQDASVDVAVASLSLHYLKNALELKQFFTELKRVLKKEGRFLFLIPHPLGTLLDNNSAWYFGKKFKGVSYFNDEDTFFPYKIKHLSQKKTLEVGLYHHTLETYVGAIIHSGFVLTNILEPRPTKELVKKYNLQAESNMPYFLLMEAKLWQSN